MTDPYVCCFGEVLWDILPTGRMPGGAPMNVALQLANLGVQSVMVSRVGNDALGEEIREFVSKKKCDSHWIQTDHQHKTGTVIADLTNPKEVSYTIVSPAAWDHIELDDHTAEKIKGAFALVYGTLACRHEQSLKTLLSLLDTTALKIFDVNFRTPFYTKKLVRELMQKADIAKMNQQELEIMNQWFGSVNFSLKKKIENLKSLFHLKKILVTMGSEGATVLDDTGLFHSPVYKVVVKDTIGSGDAFLAGAIKCLIDKSPTGYMLKYACALGALVASHHGANPEIKESDIYKLTNS